MNKVILTDERVFMAVVGPSGSGKTRLVHKMLAGNTFQPKLPKVYYFYRHYQEIYNKMKRDVNIEFLPCIDFDMIEGLTDCLLVFDDSCEEIYNDRRFLKLATAGRHQNLHVIYIKHNLFHQSKNSRTIDLNTTHVILFNSPRDVNQIKYFGKQLNLTKFLEDAYRKAMSQPFGHLLIDFSPRTSDYFRYCSNVTPPGYSIFYFPPSKAVETTVDNERERSALSKVLGQY